MSLLWWLSRISFADDNTYFYDVKRWQCWGTVIYVGTTLSRWWAINEGSCLIYSSNQEAMYNIHCLLITTIYLTRQVFVLVLEYFLSSTRPKADVYLESTARITEIIRISATWWITININSSKSGPRLWIFLPKVIRMCGFTPLRLIKYNRTDFVQTITFTQYIHPMILQCWPSVFNAGPA